MESINQAEFYERFDAYLKDKVPEGDPARWYVNELLKFDKDLQKQNITVRAGFYVDNNLIRIEEDV